MAIELECSICGQEHRFRDEHAGRKTRCKECTARIDIPRGGLGGVLDGTTPVFTPPVILVGCFLLAALLLVVVWELAGSSRPSTVPTQTVARSAPLPTLPPTTIAATSLPDRSTQTQIPSVTSPPTVNPTPNASTFEGNRPPSSPSSPTNLSAGNPIGRTRPSLPGTVSANEMARIRENYVAQRSPLVKFETPANQPVLIQSIAPTWAEPGQTVVLRGKGFSNTTRVLAIDNIRFLEHELMFRVISDSELEVNSPPECERRPECVFVFEVYAPDGVAVTLPDELAEVSKTILSDFAIVRQPQVSVVLATFAIVDDPGSIDTVNTARIYLRTPSQPLKFWGVATKIFQTKESNVGQVAGGKVEAVTVPAIFPCHVDQMFAGPQCRIRRLLFR